ncbi:hypothetical protein ABII15_03080 [Streptomyces sp. HUAS MG91]|uniref:Uncharacterized protein n=1 Tax=Streptomyces tabacisoli TaxID=3156398 RepID=A0AAU8ILD3_9ACTN
MAAGSAAEQITLDRGRVMRLRAEQAVDRTNRRFGHGGVAPAVHRRLLEHRTERPSPARAGVCSP